MDFITSSTFYMILMAIVTITSVIIACYKNLGEVGKILSKFIDFIFYRRRQEEKINKIISSLEENNKMTNELRNKVSDMDEKNEVAYENCNKKMKNLNNRIDDVEILGLKQMIWNPNTSLEERVEAGYKYVNVFHRNSTTKALYLSLKKKLEEKEDELVENQLNKK